MGSCQGLRGSLTEPQTIARREVAEMQEPEGKRNCLDALCSHQQLLANEPQPSQTQISMQAHAAVAQDRIVPRAKRDADLPRKLLAVGRLAEIARQPLFDFLEDFEMPDGVGVGGPSDRN